VEQSDVIVDIGEWVIAQALAQMAQWQAQGQVWPVSVNIAARHFQREDFFPRLQLLLAAQPDVSPELLEFEILESVALGDLHAINALIASCRQLGIRFSLDDFGTGYSSLSYLKRIPVQTLKIDQSFVRDMLDDRDDRALVESIIHIATLFKLSVIAEGVETQEQGVLLLGLGCDVVQGYGIARPMPAEQVLDWARRYQPDVHWRLWTDMRCELGDLPLLAAQNEHLAWIDRLIQAAKADTHTALVEPPEMQACRLGQWLSGPGRQRHSGQTAFNELVDVHEKIHQLAKTLLHLQAIGATTELLAMCDVLDQLKRQLVHQLEALQQATWMTLPSAEPHPLPLPAHPAADHPDDTP